MASLLVRIGPIPRPGGLYRDGTAECRARRLSFYTIDAADGCLCRIAAKPDNRSTARSFRNTKPEYRAPGERGFLYPSLAHDPCSATVYARCESPLAPSVGYTRRTQTTGRYGWLAGGRPEHPPGPT